MCKNTPMFAEYVGFYVGEGFLKFHKREPNPIKNVYFV
jgi:hypothetical protein